MTVKAIVDGLRTAGGYSGAAVYAAGQELFSENLEHDYAVSMLRLLHCAAGVRRVSVAARGFTFVAFSAECYDVLLKLAGRFPPVPALCLAEPEFVDPSCEPALLSKEMAQVEAEAALRAFGLIE